MGDLPNLLFRQGANSKNLQRITETEYHRNKTVSQQMGKLTGKNKNKTVLKKEIQVANNYL